VRPAIRRALTDRRPNAHGRGRIHFGSSLVSANPTGDDRYQHLEKITPLWAGAFSGSHPNSLERALVQTTFLFSIDDAPAGRVYVNFQPAFLPNDLTPIVRVEVTARGRPRGESVAEDQVVPSFAAVTTQEMHKLWGRTDVKR
jgi:hypothetical protein